MGMCAEIVAIGPFSEAVQEFLDYDATLYASTRPGTAVIVELFGIAEGSTASRDFAACLGITDPWDFNQHKIKPGSIDFDELQRLLQSLQGKQQYLKDLKRLIVLSDNGFEFYFRPNG